RHHRGARSGDHADAHLAQPRMIRVFIADDHQLIRAGFRQLAADDHLIAVVGEAAEGGELLRQLERTRTDVVILDIGRPGPGFAGGAHEALSAREYQVLCLLGTGKSNKEIAVTLSVGPKTVSTYRSRVLRKLSLKTNADLVRYVIEQGLAP